MSQGRKSGASFTQQVKKVKEGLEKVTPIFLRLMAEEVVRLSPKQPTAEYSTGAYMAAHTIKATSRSGSGQFSGSFKKGKKSPDGNADARAGLENLLQQIEDLPKDVFTYSITNTVAHAYKVEYEGWGSKPPYMVYSLAKAKAASFIEQAKREAGL